jgi:hypothetical protein
MSPIKAIPARLLVIPPAIAAACLELPSGLTSSDPCPPSSLSPAPIDVLVAGVEVANVVSCTVEVDNLVERVEPEGTVCVLVK